MSTDQSFTSSSTKSPKVRPKRAASSKHSAPQWKRKFKRSHHRAATASSGCHWGEWVQGPIDEAVVGLITVVDGTFQTTAIVKRQRGSGVFSVQPEKWKAFRAACLTLEAIAVRMGLWFRLFSNIPGGVGGGSSTADCLALVRAILALAGELGKKLTDLEQLRVVFEAERACDPLALTDLGLPILWGSRIGKVLRVFDTPMPAFVGLGFVSDPGHAVSTDDLVRKQSTWPSNHVDAFAKILQKFESGLKTSSARVIAEAATESATLNQGACPIRKWDELCSLASNLGAVGISASHSGTAVTWLWEPSINDLTERLAEARAVLHRLGAAYVHRFSPA